MLLILVCGAIMVTAHFVFKRIPKPSFVDRGEPIICNPVPDFSSYKVDLGTGPVIIPINFTSNTRALAMQNEILAATSSGINFSQKYLLVEASCGVTCQNHAIIDSITGNIMHYGMRTTGGVSFRPDSSLLIVNPIGNNITRYYDFKEGVLRYICEK